MKRDTECQLSILKEMEENKEFSYVVGRPSNWMESRRREEVVPLATLS